MRAVGWKEEEEFLIRIKHHYQCADNWKSKDSPLPFAAAAAAAFVGVLAGVGRAAPRTVGGVVAACWRASQSSTAQGGGTVSEENAARNHVAASREIGMEILTGVALAIRESRRPGSRDDK
jgi:hypothetical protein